MAAVAKSETDHELASKAVVKGCEGAGVRSALEDPSEKEEGSAYGFDPQRVSAGVAPVDANCPIRQQRREKAQDASLDEQLGSVQRKREQKLMPQRFASPDQEAA